MFISVNFLNLFVGVKDGFPNHVNFKSEKKAYLHFRDLRNSYARLERHQ